MACLWGEFWAGEEVLWGSGYGAESVQSGGLAEQLVEPVNMIMDVTALEHGAAFRLGHAADRRVPVGASLSPAHHPLRRRYPSVKPKPEFLCDIA